MQFRAVWADYITYALPGGTYSWGEDIVLAETELADGTAVSVPMQGKTYGMDSRNGTYIKAYANAAESVPTGEMITQPAGWEEENSSDKLTEWTEASFETVVRNGKIVIKWGITGPNSAEIYPGQIFYFKSIDFTIKE